MRVSQYTRINPCSFGRWPKVLTWGGVLSGRELLALMVSEGDAFGIPPMRLVKGAVLDAYNRFPRSNEHALIVQAVPLSAKEILTSSADNFGVHFISHRWASPETPDTADNTQVTE